MRRVELLLEEYKACKHRSFMVKNYLSVWRQFNEFLIKFDKKPKLWEDHAMLFSATLIERGVQSSTLRSYISAIKGLLVDNGYDWDNNKMLLRTLSRACRVVNDRIKVRFPIHKALLEVILFEVQRLFASQPYLEILYTAFFILCYYGLFRVGELAIGSHPVKASDVHIALNKKKMLFILYSSKMHGKESKLQKIKITVTSGKNNETQVFCPLKCAHDYLVIHGRFLTNNDPFFIYQDQLPLQPYQARNVFRTIFNNINLNGKLYDLHSFRIGRATDPLKFGTMIEQVKLAGH